eukprot:scaffold3240_cov187-Amphora_coffeaeformis.AAC.7
MPIWTLPRAPCTFGWGPTSCWNLPTRKRWNFWANNMPRPCKNRTIRPRIPPRYGIKLSLARFLLVVFLIGRYERNGRRKVVANHEEREKRLSLLSVP